MLMIALDDAVNVACEYMRNELDGYSSGVREMVRQELLQKCWRPEKGAGGTDAVKDVYGFICDINPAEIASQIENDNLRYFCKSWQAGTQLALRQMTRGEKDDQQSLH